MIPQEYPDVAETVSRVTLPNGLGVVVIRKRGYKTARAELTVNCGGVDRRLPNAPNVPSGTAHFLEHMLFRTENGGDASEELTKGGADVNACTSPDVTSFYIEGTTYALKENLPKLLKLIFNPRFDERSVDAERGIIRREILMVRDDPDERLSRGLLECLYAESPLRDDTAGSVESIESITADILLKFHRSYYTPSNAVLTVAGDLEPELIRDMAIESTPDLVSVLFPRDYGRDRSKYPFAAHRETKMDIAAPMFLAGIKTAQRVDYEFMLTAKIALDTLMGSSSELYRNLYAGGLLNDTFGFDTELNRAGCYITFGGESALPYKALSEIFIGAEQFAPDDGAIERCKRAYFGRAVMDYDSLENLCSGAARDWFCGGDVFTLPNIVNGIKSSDVREFINKYIKPELTAASYVRAG